MKSYFYKFSVFVLLSIVNQLAWAGTWSDDFSSGVLGSRWRGDRDHFSVEKGTLKGVSASPLAPVPLRWIEVGTDWDNYVVQCRINVVTPNLLVCTKGALILRHQGNEGYVFALHVATQTVEVYRLSDQEMLLLEQVPLELKQGYSVRAVLQGENMSFYLDDKLIGTVNDKRSGAGAIGLAVQDALEVQYDDFTVTGPQVEDPGLNLSCLGDKITLVWPTSPSGLILKSADTLMPEAQWTTVTTPPTIVGNQYFLQLDAASSRRFYNLFPAGK
jgi:hypothetical protein